MSATSEDISLIAKTFERPECLKQLLDSIREQFGSTYPVLVADDSTEPYRDEILNEYGDIVTEYIVLPFNTGVSAGRNALLERVETEYFVLNDDDFFYGPMTRLDQAVSVLNAHSFDILGGPLLEKRRRYILPQIPKRISDFFHLYQDRWIHNSWVASIAPTDDGGVAVSNHAVRALPHTCDLILNFFVARTAAVRDVVGGWDPALKSIGEHWEFFYRCKKARLKVGFTDQFSAYHHAIEDSNTYRSHRHDHEDTMISRSLQAHGFRYLMRGSRILENKYHKSRAEPSFLSHDDTSTL